jgi:hypothetical protein
MLLGGGHLDQPMEQRFQRHSVPYLVLVILEKGYGYRCKYFHYWCNDLVPTGGKSMIDKNELIGRHPTLSEQDYHADQALGNSSLRLLLKSPAHFMYGEPVKSQSTEDGSIIHKAILEPDKFDECFVVASVPDDKITRGTKAWQALVEYGNGRQAIKQGQRDVAFRMRDAAHSEPSIRGILRKFNPEVSYFADTGMGFRVKSRFDIDDSPVPEYDFDLKSVASLAKWEAHAEDYGYNTAVYHYPFVKSLVTGQPMKKMAFIAIEKEAPYVCQIFQPDDAVLSKGEADARRAYEIYAECLSKNEWPKPRAKVTPYGLPKWVKWDEG